MTNASAALDALGDPTRRRVLELLHTRERTVRELTDALPVTQSAVSQHLRVLREAGLVRDVVNGRQREYQLVVSALAELEAYLASLRAPAIDWERRFAALETEVYRVRNQRRAAARRVDDAPVTRSKQESA